MSTAYRKYIKDLLGNIIYPYTDEEAIFVGTSTLKERLSNIASDISDKVDQSTLGISYGVATLDANGRLNISLLPISATAIVGYLDAANVHTLTNAYNYNEGDLIVVTSDGYFNQSTAFTLSQGKTLTDLEVSKANQLIDNSYVFTLKSGNTTLGTVTKFAKDKVTIINGESESDIDLPYTADLSATSEPSTVPITVLTGDLIMNIDNHWVTLSHTNYVDSVNSKTGAVVLTASDVGAVSAVAITDTTDYTNPW